MNATCFLTPAFSVTCIGSKSRPSFDMPCNHACIKLCSFKMVKNLSEDLHWRVIYHRYIYGSSIEETAGSLFVSKRFVSNIKALYERTKDVKPTRRKGRPRVLSFEYEMVKRQMIMKAAIVLYKHVLSTTFLPTQDRDNALARVRKVDSAIHRINHYPADSVVCFVDTYPVDSNLSGG